MLCEFPYNFCRILRLPKTVFPGNVFTLKPYSHLRLEVKFVEVPTIYECNENTNTSICPSNGECTRKIGMHDVICVIMRSMHDLDISHAGE